jgi:hypothetical protein
MRRDLRASSSLLGMDWQPFRPLPFPAPHLANRFSFCPRSPQAALSPVYSSLQFPETAAQFCSRIVDL